RGATRAAFDNLVELAIDEQVDFVVLAGDLYDGDWKDYGTGLYFAACMSRLRVAGVRVFLALGNHDAESAITRALTLPANVHRFASQAPETVVDESLGVALHGQSFAAPAVTDNLASRYPEPIRGLFNV